MRYDVVLSLPSVVGREGVSEVIWPAMSADETQSLERSAGDHQERGRELSGQELRLASSEAAFRMTLAADKSGHPERLDGPDLGLAMLAIGAGSMDAFGFFALGGALPSAMTGNTALLGLALGQGHLTAAAPPFAAGTGFVLGAALASALLHLHLAKLPAPRTVAWLLAVEACLLAGFLLAWQFGDRRAAGLSLYVLILLGAAGMGIQSVAARQDGRPGVTTVVFTSALTAIVSAVTSAVLGSPHRLGFAAKRQIFMFLAYGVGAVTSGFLTWYAIDAIPFLPVLAALVALCLHQVSDRTSARPQAQ